MSKAFTRESDDAPERPAPPRPAVVLPAGVKNLLTPGGALRIQVELEQLAEKERKLREAGDDEARQQFQSSVRRIQQLQQTLHSAVVTGPPSVDDGVVRFGATVAVRERSREEMTYRIVGVDEVDLDQNWVSWLSPIAKALLHARVGERVRLKLPGGEEELEILGVHYE